MGHGAASGVKPIVEQRQGGGDDGQDRIVKSRWQRFMLHRGRSGAGTRSSCRLAFVQCAAALRIWSEGRAASQRRTGSRRQHRGDFGHWPSAPCAAWLRAGLGGTIHGSARSSCIGARPVRAHEPASAVSRCPGAPAARRLLQDRVRRRGQTSGFAHQRFRFFAQPRRAGDFFARCASLGPRQKGCL